MSDTLVTALQLCPFSARMEDDLAKRLDLVRWFELDDAAQDTFLASRAESVRVVLTGGHIGCPPDLMRRLPTLGLVAINGVGFDKVDLPLAAERGVAVANTPDVLTEDVADLAVGLLISLKRRLPAADRHVRSGAWENAGDLPLARKVSGCRFGILGLGRIGGAIAQRLAPFGPVAYTARSDKANDHTYIADPVELARWADVLVIACAATPETRGLVDAAVLEALGADGCLVNVSRGSVVDEDAVIAALTEDRLAGAALDVFAAEPHVPQALRDCDRVVLTPHIASATVETRQAMADLVLANVDSFLAGNGPVTPV